MVESKLKIEKSTTYVQENKKAWLEEQEKRM